jgi:anti-sigma factor RsiW
MSGQSQLHLDETRLQGLADGSLRGPEGQSARGHCDVCEECAAELEAYTQLARSLDALCDPPPPADFTMQVLLAVDAREAQLEARRHIKLAAIPAGLVAIVAVVGWAFSAGPVQRLDEVIRGFTALRQIYEVAEPVVGAARVPLALGALLCSVVLGLLLRGAIRRTGPVVAR